MPKEELSIQVQTALEAHRLGRPVKTVLTRKQSAQLHPKRHPMVLHYKVGADADGHLLAVYARIVGDTKVLSPPGGRRPDVRFVGNADVFRAAGWPARQVVWFCLHCGHYSPLLKRQTARRIFQLETEYE